MLLGVAQSLGKVMQVAWEADHKRQEGSGSGMPIIIVSK